jgi:hypothetical protein
VLILKILAWLLLTNASFVVTYAITVLVTSREAWPVNVSEVSEPCFLEVMRALGIKALVLLTVILSGLESIFVALSSSIFAIVKDIMVVPVTRSPRDHIPSRTATKRHKSEPQKGTKIAKNNIKAGARR